MLTILSKNLNLEVLISYIYVKYFAHPVYKKTHKHVDERVQNEGG